MTETVFHTSTFGVGLYGGNAEVAIIPSVAASAKSFKVIHASEFDAYQNILPVFPSIETVYAKVNAKAKPYSVIHQSSFDILSTVKINASVQAYINPITTVSTPVAIATISAYPRISGDTTISLELTPTITVYPTISATAEQVVPDDDSIIYGSLTFQYAKRKDKDKITPILEDRFAKAGVSEPLAYTRVITLTAETNKVSEHTAILNLIGKRLYLWVYGTPYPYAYISNLSDMQVKPGLSRFQYEIEFTLHVFTSENKVMYGGVSLSHPSRSAPDAISPSYSCKTGAGYGISKLVPAIKRTWTFECVTESEEEYTNLISLIGSRNTLVLNDAETFLYVYISDLSSLQPMGTSGELYAYTIEFQRDSGDNPVVATFDSITLPNATAQSVDVEILQTETTLHDGRVVADIGTIPKRTWSFSCSSNSDDEYEALYATIGTKAALVVDDKPYKKCWISVISNVGIIVGEDSDRLYTWDMEVKEDTS